MCVSLGASLGLHHQHPHPSGERDRKRSSPDLWPGAELSQGVSFFPCETLPWVMRRCRKQLSCQHLPLLSSFVFLPESSQWWVTFSNKSQGVMWVTVVLDPRSAELRALSGYQVRARGSRVHSGIWRDLGEGTLLSQPPQSTEIIWAE